MTTSMQTTDTGDHMLIVLGEAWRRTYGDLVAGGETPEADWDEDEVTYLCAKLGAIEAAIRATPAPRTAAGRAIRRELAAVLLATAIGTDEEADALAEMVAAAS